MINKERIKKQVQKAISTMPTTIELKRIGRVDNGDGSYSNGEIDVATFDGFLDESGSGLQININEGGQIDRVKKIYLIAVYDESFTILKDDYFTADNRKYRVYFPGNLFGIAWQCDLEVIS